MLKIVIIIHILSCATLIGQSYLQEIDSLKSQIQYTTSNTKKVDLLNDLSYSFRRISPDSISYYANQALDLSESENYILGQSIAYKNLGIAGFKEAKDYQKTIQHYEKSMELAYITEDYYTVVACLNNIGLVYNILYQIQKARKYFFEALEIYDDKIKGTDRLKGLIIANLGTAYHRLGDVDEEMKYISLALQFAKEHGHESLYSIYADNYARALIRLGKYEEAIEECQQVIIVQKKLGDDLSYLQTLITISGAKIHLGEYNEALVLINEAYENAKEKKFRNVLAEVLLSKSKVLEKLELYESGIEAAKEAYQVSLLNADYVIGAEASKLLSNFYTVQGDDKNAIAAYKKFHNFTMKRVDIETEHIATELEIIYEKEKQDQEILKLNQQNSQRGIAVTIFGFLLALLTGVLIYTVNLYRNKNRTTEELLSKNNMLEEAEKTLELKNTELEKYIESNIQLEQFAHVASHDLKSPLRTVSSFTGLLKRKTYQKLNEKEQQYFSFIESATKQMSNLVNDLLVYSKANSQQIHLSKIELHSFLGLVLDNLQFAIDEKKAKISISEMPESIFSDEVKLKQIFQNLVSNAIKFSHSQRDPEIYISCKAEKDHWLFSVQDNGIGIPEEYFDNIFSPYTQLHTKQQYDGSGLGLSICQKLVKQFGGKIWVDSKYDKGATFHFSIPKVESNK